MLKDCIEKITFLSLQIVKKNEKEEVKLKISSSESEKEIVESIPNTPAANDDDFVGFCRGGNKNLLLALKTKHQTRIAKIFESSQEDNESSE